MTRIGVDAYEEGIQDYLIMEKQIFKKLAQYFIVNVFPSLVAILTSQDQ